MSIKVCKTFFHKTDLDSITEEYFSEIQEIVEKYNVAAPDFFEKGEKLQVKKDEYPYLWGHIIYNHNGKEYPVRIQCLADKKSLEFWVIDGNDRLDLLGPSNKEIKEITATIAYVVKDIIVSKRGGNFEAY